MGRKSRFAIILAAVAAFVSCVKENADAPAGCDMPSGTEFSISLVQTKTINDGLATRWVEGDMVNVFHAEAGTTDYINDGAFTFATNDRFTGYIKNALEEGKFYDWYVTYPYDPTMESPKSMKIEIPAIQNQVADGDMSHLCGSLCPLAGKTTGVLASENLSVMMSHLVTVMKIKVTNYEAQPCNLKTVSFCHHTKKNEKTILSGIYFVDMTGESIVYKRSEDSEASLSEGDPARPYINLENPKVLGLNESATVYIACLPYIIENSSLLCIGMNKTDDGISQAIYGKNPVCRAGAINSVKQGSRLAPPFKNNVTFYCGMKNPDGTYTMDDPNWWRCELPEGYDLQGEFDFKELFTTVNSDAEFTMIAVENQNANVRSMYDDFAACLTKEGLWTGSPDLEVNLHFPESDRSGVFINSSAGYNVGSWAIMYREPIEEDAPEVDTEGDMYDSYHGLVMAGYQGWHGTPDDGCPHNPSEGWPHYANVSQHPFIFEPGVLRNNIDFWPDVREYERTYPATGFTCPDGSTPRLYSSYDASTVYLHFKWMKDYGIDGVFMQRFVSQITDAIAIQHQNKVLESAMMASNIHARAISVMYDMVGMDASTSADVILDDARDLIAKYNLMDRDAGQRYYLYHNGKPLIGLVSVGQKSASYTVAQAQAIVDGLQELGFSIFLGVPAYWRDANGKGDVVNDPALITLVQDVDIIMPWMVGVYDYDGSVTTSQGKFSEFFENRILGDFSKADEYGVEFCPLVFPGFSDKNMHPDHSIYDRFGGSFYWQQIYRYLNHGASMLYVAMFDEIDEGTAIYKCLRKDEVPSNTYSSDYYVVFENGAYSRSDTYVAVSNGWCKLASELGVTFNGIENNLDSDYYLRLTGHASKILKGQAQLTESKPF